MPKMFKMPKIEECYRFNSRLKTAPTIQFSLPIYCSKQDRFSQLRKQTS
jgi:hypothetical protein